jgi:type II secretory pathway component PulF
MASRLQDLADVYSNLSSLLSAGVDLRRALQTAAGSVQSPHTRSLRSISQCIGQGASLAEAMDAQAGLFAPLDVRMVEMGEQSGQLDRVFANLAEWYRNRARMRSTILAGMVLPVVMLLAAAFLAPLPSLFLKDWDWGAYAVSVASILVFYLVPGLAIWMIVQFTPPTGPARSAVDHLAAGVPILGTALRNLAYSRYFRSLHIYLQSGLPITAGARAAAELCNFAPVRKKVLPGAEAVAQGRNLSEGLAAGKVPARMVDVVVVGEESGKLDESTQRLSEQVGQLAMQNFRVLSQWLPRLAYFLVGALMVYFILKNVTELLKSTGMGK